MKTGFRIILVLLLSVAGASAGAPEWAEVKSPHFSVITDAGEKRGREVALRFEQMRSVFGTLMTRGKVNIPVPLQIVAFRNTKELRQVAPLWKGKPTELSGLFVGGQDRGFIMLDMSVENPWQVVFHEYGHQLMSGNSPDQLDPWFAEGFAEYFSSIEVDGKQARVGKISVETYEIVNYTGLMKVGDLIRVQPNSSVYNESGDHRTSFYATSSMLVHYIYDKQLIPKVGEYFAQVRAEGKRPEEAFQNAFGMTPAQFDKLLQQYVSSRHFMYYALPAPSDLKPESFASRPYREVDARVVIADIHVHSSDYQEKAETELQNVLKEDPRNASALRGLGYIYLRKQDRERAGEYFQKAVEQDGNDPWVLYYSALLFRDGAEGANGASIMQSRLEKATQLYPEFADAYSLLGYALLLQAKNEDAVKPMLTAVQLSPQNMSYRFNLANAYLQMRNYQRATALLKVLQTSSDPQIAVHAQQALQNIEDAKRTEADFEAQTAEMKATSPSANGLLASRTVQATPEQPTAVIPQGSIAFAKGKVVGIDCSAKPEAVLQLSLAGKLFKLHIKDTGHVVVIGADEFSCGWVNQKIAVNYRTTGEGSGEVVSLEIQ